MLQLDEDQKDKRKINFILSIYFDYVVIKLMRFTHNNAGTDG